VLELAALGEVRNECSSVLGKIQPVGAGP
jgi:hypothetical protein